MIILIWVIVFGLSFGEEISYNRPNLSTCAEWKVEGINLPTEPSDYGGPYSLFVDRNNTVYVTYPYNNLLDNSTFPYRLYEWRDGTTRPSRIISNGLSQPFGMFVVSTGEIYVNYGTGRVDKWKSKVNTYESVAQFCSYCWSMFISWNDMIYCSMRHSVVTKPLRSNSNRITMIAGTGIGKSEAQMLNVPMGIFVDLNLDLYVADFWNHRVQLFRSGTINGITLLTRSNTFKNFAPTDVALDANQNVYIVDAGENRILSGTLNNFKCIVGCGEKDILLDLFSFPKMDFDSFGNIYYIDHRNDRVKKFLLSKNKCDSPNENKLSITSTSTSIKDISTSIQSVFSSILTENSSTYINSCDGPVYYYESIRINVSKEGYYEFVINRTMGTDVKIYNKLFDPLNTFVNLIFYFEEQCSVGEMTWIINLKNDQIYDLVVATLSPNITSSYSVLLIGPSRIDFNRLNISNSIETKYSSEFTINSPECDSHMAPIPFDFYCQCIQIDTTREGHYIIRFNISTVIFGSVYGNNFTLFDLRINKETIEIDSRYMCKTHVKMLLYREMNSSMILIVKAEKKLEPNAFSIIVEGPSKVSMQRINETKSIIQTNYSSEFRNQSWKHGFHNCLPTQYYFEALQITVNTSDYYMFITSSQFNTYGSLYEYSSFDPFSSHDTSFVNSTITGLPEKFKITVYLQLNMIYVLLITADCTNVYRQGPFTLIASGFHRIDIKRMNHLSITTMNKTIVQYVYSSELTTNNPTFHVPDCEFDRPGWYYELMQINVIQSGNYTISITSQSFSIEIGMHEKHFNPYIAYNLLIHPNADTCPEIARKLIMELQPHVTYILVVAADIRSNVGNFSVFLFGPNRITLNKLHLQRTYESELTEKSPIYSRECSKESFHYESIELTVEQNGFYSLNSSNTIRLYGYLYQDQFDPSYPHENLLTQSSFQCKKHRFYLGNILEMNRIYILVVTTLYPNVRGSFQLLVTGPSNVTFKRINSAYSSCVVGDQCNPYRKSIGLTMNDLLRDQIKRNISFNKQSSLILSTGGITMIMFLIGLVNGICSLTTFQNKELRTVGCVLYLFTCSIMSLLTIRLTNLNESSTIH